MEPFQPKASEKARGRKAPRPDLDPGGEPRSGTTSEKPFVAILGATSPVGRYLVRRLADGGFEGLCFSRRASPVPYGLPPGFSWTTGFEERQPRVPTILFSLVPLPALPNLIDRMADIELLIALSTSSVTYKTKSTDPKERCMAEAVSAAKRKIELTCRDRSTRWTILRPTLIYDPGRDRNVTAIAAFIRRFGAFPIIWPGTGLRQPIHAAEVAQAMFAALTADDARGTVLDLPGGETLTYREMVRRIFNSLGRRPVLLYLPLSPARMAFGAWKTVTGVQYSAAALERMNTDLVFNSRPMQDVLGMKPRPFAPEFTCQGLREECSNSR